MRNAAIAVALVLALAFALRGANAPSGTPFDRVISANNQKLLADGRQIFRFDTFGDEAFWADALKLHQAIAGAKNGGVGGGVSPRTALAVGLKVDSDALPDLLKRQIKAGQVNLDD